MQCRIEQFTGHVTGERTTGPVGTLFAGREPDHEQFRVEQAESRNRQRVPVRIALADGSKVFCQARTGSALLRILE